MSQSVTPPKLPSDPDLSGRQLGDFHLLRRLGEGAMAEVYLAEQASLRRQVAIKVLKRRLADDAVYIRRFQREAQAAASLVHATIVQIYEVGQADGLYYIAQEYVQGLNLRQWTTRHGAPDARLALRIMRQVAAALAKAAEQGIVHRDIKPENILLTRTAEVKVADFGLARLLNEGARTDLTEIGITLGTPLYMSPEQVEGRPLDPRSDIYSFGVTCYQMLSGGTPFAGDTALSVALQHIKRVPDPLENHRPDLPPALCRAIHKMLAKLPEGRFASAKELLAELRRIQASCFSDEAVDEIDYDVSEIGETSVLWNAATQRLSVLMKSDTATSRRRSRWWIGGWAATACAALAFGIVFAERVSPPASVLAEANIARPVFRGANVFQQWLFATQAGTQEAWQSVIDYFPDEKYTYYHNRARRQMVNICLSKGDVDEAANLFEQLVAFAENEGDRAYGLAGECIVLTRLGRYHESAEKLDALWPIQDKINDPTMSRMLRYALQRNRQNISPKMKPDEWRRWFAEQAPESQ